SPPSYSTRWADSKNWVLDFDKPLPSGHRCIFSITPDAKDVAGHPVRSLNQYSFTTSGPAILGVAPMYGEIEPDQYFVLLTDGEIDESSVLKNAFFEVADLPDSIGVKIVKGPQREAVIKAAIKSNWEWHPYQRLIL